jgi:hypothetical protein
VGQHPLQIVCLLVRVGVCVVCAPVIKPASPILTVDKRAVGANFLQLCKRTLGVAVFFATEVDSDGKFRQRSSAYLLRPVGGVELDWVKPASTSILWICSM